MKKKINMGTLSMIMTILGGIVSLIGGIAGTLDAHKTAEETARETAEKLLSSDTEEA